MKEEFPAPGASGACTAPPPAPPRVSQLLPHDLSPSATSPDPEIPRRKCATLTAAGGAVAAARRRGTGRRAEQLTDRRGCYGGESGRGMVAGLGLVWCFALAILAASRDMVSVGVVRVWQDRLFTNSNAVLFPVHLFTSMDGAQMNSRGHRGTRGKGGSTIQMAVAETEMMVLGGRGNGYADARSGCEVQGAVMAIASASPLATKTKSKIG